MPDVFARFRITPWAGDEPMPENATGPELVSKASSGDRAALQELLLLHYEPLAQHLARQMSPQDRGMMSVDDVIQQTFVQVVKDIERFTPQTDKSFFAWLKKIAQNRLQDSVRRLRRAKRGGDSRQVREGVSPDGSSLADLAEMLSAGSHRPSGSAIRHEAVAAVRQSIESLPEQYRQAVQLRLLEGKSLEETGAMMNCSPRAVQGLVDRAKKKMRAATR